MSHYSYTLFFVPSSGHFVYEKRNAHLAVPFSVGMTVVLSPSASGEKMPMLRVTALHYDKETNALSARLETFNPETEFEHRAISYVFAEPGWKSWEKGYLPRGFPPYSR